MYARQVPTENKDVFSYKVDWKAFVNECRSKIESWLKKKVAEYFVQNGNSESEEAVDEIVEFITSKLGNSTEQVPLVTLSFYSFSSVDSVHECGAL